MGSHRKEKLPQLLQHLAAEFVERVSNRTSLITVTGISLDRKGRHAKILFTVLPESEEGVVSEFLNRQKKDLSEYIDKHAIIGFMPSFEFAIDVGEKNRQRIDFLLQNEDEKKI